MIQKKLGELALERKWISEEALQKCLLQQSYLRKQGVSFQKTLIGGIFLEHHFLNVAQLNELLEIQKVAVAPTILSTQVSENASVLELIHHFGRNVLDSNKNTDTLLGSSQETPLFSPAQIESRNFSIEEKKKERYEVLKELGQGGMGLVQLVKDHLLGREVARKVLRYRPSFGRSFSREQEFYLWRLAQEASVTSILEHPNIVPLYEMQQHGAHELQFTMRKIDGETFRTLLREVREKKRFYEKHQLLGILLKVCDAVSYAHARGVIHRDLKPENIMVGQFGEVYVMDWGIAKKLQTADPVSVWMGENPTPTFSVSENNFADFRTIGGLGTPGYMAPEQKKEASLVRIQADIYALGKILRECFTLTSPMEELKNQLDWASKISKRQKISHEEMERLFHTSSIPSEIEAIIHKATEEDPEKRYESIQRFSEDIQRYLTNYPVSAKEYKPMEVFFKWSRRHQKTLIFMGLIGFFCCGFFGYLKWLGWEQKRRENERASRFLHEAKNLLQQPLLYDSQNPDRETRSNQIHHFLQILSSLNKVLTVPSEYTQTHKLWIETKKKDILQQLLKFCEEEEDYQMALFLACEMETLSILSETEKKRFYQEVYERKNEKLTQHLRTFETWIHRFKSREESLTLDEGDVENFLYEVHSMQEPEIRDRLILLLQEGTLSIQQSSEVREARLDDFYRYIVILLGRSSGSQKADTKILNALRFSLSTVAQKCLEPGEAETNRIQFLSELALALYQLNDDVSFGTIETLFYDSRIPRLFRLRLEKIYHKHLEQHLALNTIALQQNPLNVSSYLRRGMGKQAQGKLDEAFQDFSQGIALAPNNIDGYTMRGGLFIQQKNWTRAIDDFSQVLRINPDFITAYINRGVAYQYAGQWEQAIDDFSRALQKNPRLAEAYANRAWCYSQRNHFEEALIDYNYAIQMNPSYAEAYLNRGILKTNHRRYSESLEDFTKALQINPKYLEAYLNRGLSKLHLKDLDGAIGDFSQALLIHPSSSFAYNNRGLAKQRKGELESAKEDYSQAIRFSPNSLEGYFNRANLFFFQSRYQDAILDYSRILQIDPENAHAYNERGITKHEVGDLEGADADLCKAITFAPEKIQSYINRGLVRADLGQFSESITDFSIAIQKNPLALDAYLNRGTTKLKIQDFQGAEQDFKKVIHLDPEYAIAYYNLGTIAHNLGQFEDAVIYLEKSVALNNHPKIFLTLMQALSDFAVQSYRKKNYAQALEAFQKMKHYLPEDHEQLPSINQKIQRLEELTSKENDEK